MLSQSYHTHTSLNVLFLFLSLIKLVIIWQTEFCRLLFPPFLWVGAYSYKTVISLLENIPVYGFTTFTYWDSFGLFPCCEYFCTFPLTQMCKSFSKIYLQKRNSSKDIQMFNFIRQCNYCLQWNYECTQSSTVFSLIHNFSSNLESIWERLRAGEGDERGWDGWMASPTQWTWVWVDSGSWWWTGRPGVLWFLGSQRVGHDWATELNWESI